MKSNNPSDNSAPWQPLSKTRRQLLASLALTKRRRKEGLFVVEGRKNVADLLGRREGAPEVAWIAATPEYLDVRRKEVSGEWGLRHDQIAAVTPTEMKGLSLLSSPSEVLAVFRIPQATPDPVGTPLPEGIYLLLDGVQDPGNLGTIIRTAHWFGVRRIFASRDTVDLYNPKTVQSTMGSLGAVGVEYCDLPALVAANPDIPAVGLQLDGRNLFSAPLPSSAMICMGSEGNGLSAALKERLTLSLTIPPADPSDHPESLNVAVATAVTLARFSQAASAGL